VRMSTSTSLQQGVGLFLQLLSWRRCVSSGAGSPSMADSVH